MTQEGTEVISSKPKDYLFSFPASASGSVQEKHWSPSLTLNALG